MNTEAFLQYPKSCMDGYGFDCQPTIKYDLGDGTVLDSSLSYGNNWEMTKLIPGYRIDGQDHNDVLKSKEGLELLS